MELMRHMFYSALLIEFVYERITLNSEHELKRHTMVEGRERGDDVCNWSPG